MTNKTVVNGCRDFMADGWRRCSMWWQRRRQCALFLANGQVGKDKIIARRRPDDQQNNQIKRHEEENFDDYCPLLNRLRSRNERWVRQYIPHPQMRIKGGRLHRLDIWCVLGCWPISLLHILVESLGISYLCMPYSFYIYYVFRLMRQLMRIAVQRTLTGLNKYPSPTGHGMESNDDDETGMWGIGI